MSNPTSPAIRVAVDKGKTYYWCSCGLSKSQPFCDGSHKDDEQNRKPLIYTGQLHEIFRVLKQAKYGKNKG